MTHIDKYGNVWHYIPMPTLLIYKNILIMIHTKDHGFPHVTCYVGKEGNWYEAMAKIRIDNLTVLENNGFSLKDIRVFLSLAQIYQKEWLEKWYEIKKDQ